MKTFNLRSRQKILFYISSALLLSTLTGCSDNSEKNEKAKDEIASSASKSTSSQKIEVVANENAKEIKVAQKANVVDRNDTYYYDYNLKDSSKVNSFIANEKALAESKPARTAIDANLYVRSPYEKVQISMLVKKLSKKFIVKCSACHNDYANGIIGPSLLGKNSDYIYNKIAEFKSGKAQNVLMTDLINQMDDKEIRELANEIHQFNKSIEEMRK